MANSSKRSKVMVGELPSDFLRLDASAAPQQQQIQADQQAAAALQAAQGGGYMPPQAGAAGGYAFVTPNMSKLSITVVQAKLTKNYGLMKMDLYCRLRIGNSVFETHTANGGGKNPRWNKVLYCHIPQGVDSIYLEIFDEKAFTMDDRVAWAHINISEKVLNHESVEDWYHLNGKQGDGKEGMINLVMSTSAVTGQVIVQQQPVIYPPGVPGQMIVPTGMPVYHPPQVGGAPVTVQQPPAQTQQTPQQRQGPLFTDDDVKQVRDMFPNVEEQVVRSVLEANRGDKDATINSLLSMAS